MKDSKREYIIIPFNQNRFAIASKDEVILDDAQGYGYKSREKANKAAWYKFEGGKEKIKSDKSKSKEWIKDDVNKKMLRDIERVIMYNVKTIAIGEDTIEDVIMEIEKEYDEKVPDYVIKSFLK